MSKIIRISKLKKRQEFLIVSKEGRYVNCNNFILQFHKRPSSIGSNKNLVRYGITASKKVGNAILRNKAKRRIRVLISEIFPKFATKGFDYVIIAKNSLNKSNFFDLKIEVTKTLKNI